MLGETTLHVCLADLYENLMSGQFPLLRDLMLRWFLFETISLCNGIEGMMVLLGLRFMQCNSPMKNNV